MYGWSYKLSHKHFCGKKLGFRVQKSTVESIIRSHQMYKEVWWQVVGE